MLFLYVVQGPKIILTDLVNNSFHRSIVWVCFCPFFQHYTLELKQKNTCMQKFHLIREKCIKSTNVDVCQKILQILVHIY